MSLLRLLTTGKSLVGLKDMESRYRANHPAAVAAVWSNEKSIQQQREIRTGADRVRVPGNDVGNGASAERRGSTDSSGATRATRQSGVRDRTASTMAVVRRFTEALRLRAAGLLSGCKGKLTGMIGRVRVKAAKPAIARFPKPPVQVELSLDKIKVMRNDLSDADLEVIEGRVPTAPASPEPALRTDKEVGVAESRWGAQLPGCLAQARPSLMRTDEQCRSTRTHR